MADSSEFRLTYPELEVQPDGYCEPRLRVSRREHEIAAITAIEADEFRRAKHIATFGQHWESRSSCSVYVAEMDAWKASWNWFAVYPGLRADFDYINSLPSPA